MCGDTLLNKNPKNYMSSSDLMYIKIVQIF